MKIIMPDYAGPPGSKSWGEQAGVMRGLRMLH
jgi:hypothetical protein